MRRRKKGASPFESAGKILLGVGLIYMADQIRKASLPSIPVDSEIKKALN